MERNNIVPKHDAEKDKIKKALSIRSRDSYLIDKQADEYFAGLEEKFLQKATEMGYDYNQVKQFVEQKGLPDNDLAILVSGIGNPARYRNHMFMNDQAARAKEEQFQDL